MSWVVKIALSWNGWWIAYIGGRYEPWTCNGACVAWNPWTNSGTQRRAYPYPAYQNHSPPTTCWNYNWRGASWRWWRPWSLAKRKLARAWHPTTSSDPPTLDSTPQRCARCRSPPPCLFESCGESHSRLHTTLCSSLQKLITHIYSPQIITPFKHRYTNMGKSMVFPYFSMTHSSHKSLCTPFKYGHISGKVWYFLQAEWLTPRTNHYTIEAWTH